MGLREELAETARRVVTQDDWYVEEERYALEIESVIDPGGVNGGLPKGSAVFVLPLAPQSITTQRVLRQSITPTLGGLVAEEQGTLWNVFEISGTFGLSPKPLFNTAIVADEPARIPPGTPISGPGATRKLIKGIIERYGELKANPKFSASTRLIWHDFKMRESFVVVPEVFATSRNTTQQQQFPYSFRFRTIGVLRQSIAPTFLGKPPSVLDRVRNAISDIADAQRRIAGAILEGSAFLGEVRYFAATIDSVIGNMEVIVQSANDFVNGVSDTLSVGATFINSTASLLQSTLALMEDTAGLPVEVRQNYQEALDGLDAIASTPGVFGKTYDSEADAVRTQEAGAARTSEEARDAAEAAGPSNSASAFASRTVKATDATLVETGVAGRGGRLFGTYTGSFRYEVRDTDTLQSIAARLMGSGALWYDIAILNGLKAPYISESGVPGTVKAGAILTIPTTAATGEAAIVTEGTSPGLDLLGTDLLAVETPLSIPGRPQVDFAVDRRNLKDFKKTPSGVRNLQQALQLRVWTEQGAIPTAPDYGRARVVGFGNTRAQQRVLQLRIQQAVRSDPRVARIDNFQVKAEGDVIEITMDVLPIGEATAARVNVSSA